MKLIRTKFEKYATIPYILLFFILSQLIFIIMNQITFPLIEAGNSFIRAFDMSPMGYSFNTAQIFIENLSEHSRMVYLFVQEPLDFFYPLILSICFILIFIKLTKRGKIVLLLPILLLIFDYLENIAVICILVANQVSPTSVFIANTFTILKSLVSIIICILIIIIFIKTIFEKWRYGNAKK